MTMKMSLLVFRHKYSSNITVYFNSSPILPEFSDEPKMIFALFFIFLLEINLIYWTLIDTGRFFTGFVKNVLNIVVVPPNTHKLSLSMSKSVQNQAEIQNFTG